MRKDGFYKNCANCNKKIYVQKRLLRNNNFCSLKCFSVFSKGKTLKELGKSLNSRICILCKNLYKPAGTSQKYCINCKNIPLKGYKIKYSKSVRGSNYLKEYYQKNKEKIKEKRKIYYINNKDKIKEHRREYYQKNKSVLNQRKKEYWLKNKEKRNLISKKSYEKHKEERDAHKKEYSHRPEVIIKRRIRERKYRKNPKYRERVNKCRKERLKRDKNYLISTRLRRLFWRAFKRYTKTGKIMSSKKYGVDFKLIVEYLKPFPQDLSRYHIDHIKPLCSFDLTNPEDVRMAFAPKNHQWLPVFENMSKGKKIEIQEKLNLI